MHAYIHTYSTYIDSIDRDNDASAGITVDGIYSEDNVKEQRDISSRHASFSMQQGFLCMCSVFDAILKRYSTSVYMFLECICTMYACMYVCMYDIVISILINKYTRNIYILKIFLRISICIYSTNSAFRCKISSQNFFFHRTLTKSIARVCMYICRRTVSFCVFLCFGGGGLGSRDQSADVPPQLALSSARP